MTVDVSEERVAVVQPADNYNNSKTQLSSGFGLQEMADRTSSSSEERVAVVQPADNYNNSKTQLVALAFISRFAEWLMWPTCFSIDSVVVM